MDTNQIEGKNPVKEALRSGRPMDKILVARGSGAGMRPLLDLARQQGVFVQETDRRKLDSISRTGAHQGVIAFVSEVAYASLEDIFARAQQKNTPVFIVIADGITDPHNLGAIIRSACAAGAHGVIIPKHRSAGINAVVAKASAGAVEHIPIVKVTNISKTLEELQSRGVWVVGTALENAVDLYHADLKGNIAVVIGSEGEGMSRLVKEKCDFLVKIPMIGDLQSLNASVACGVVLYEIVRQRLG